ncbi:unnamed protein product [Ambrosiozyma monospora]|uniref:Unnamed protein product n=1 Tax=Ambrosiozyma monospora TaxID=43982 RepID=A0A9W6Z848_AMBMO|nr:unnamed protein product [Ambrosiozyma monospora]
MLSDSEDDIDTIAPIRPINKKMYMKKDPSEFTITSIVTAVPSKKPLQPITFNESESDIGDGVKPVKLLTNKKVNSIEKKPVAAGKRAAQVRSVTSLIKKVPTNVVDADNENDTNTENSEMSNYQKRILSRRQQAHITNPGMKSYAKVTNPVSNSFNDYNFNDDLIVLDDESEKKPVYKLDDDLSSSFQFDDDDIDLIEIATKPLATKERQHPDTVSSHVGFAFSRSKLDTSPDDTIMPNVFKKDDGLPTHKERNRLVFKLKQLKVHPKRIDSMLNSFERLDFPGFDDPTNGILKHSNRDNKHKKDYCKVAHSKTTSNMFEFNEFLDNMKPGDRDSRVSLSDQSDAELKWKEKNPWFIVD